MKNARMAAALAVLAATASAADWTPRRRSREEGPGRPGLARRNARRVRRGLRGHGGREERVAVARARGARRRIERVRADVGRQVVDRSRLVAGREVDRVPLRPRARRTRTARTRRPNVWRIRVDGGEAEALTDEKGGVRAIEWAPDGKTIAFLMTDPKTEDEEKADKEKRDARVVDGAPKLTRLYVVPVEKDADGKRPVRKLTEGAMSLGQPGGPVRVRLVARRATASSSRTSPRRTSTTGRWRTFRSSRSRRRRVRALAATRRGGVGSRSSRPTASRSRSTRATTRRPGGGARASRSSRSRAERRACWPRRPTRSPISSAGRRTAASCSARRTARSTAWACCRWAAAPRRS